jgi:hypothetical protein
VEVQVGVSIDNEGAQALSFDSVSREDVLAARVLRKALGGVAFVLTLVVALVAYAWRDISKQREEIETQRGQLKLQRDSLSAEVGRMQKDFQQKKDSMLKDVALARGLVGGAQAYQQALAGELVSFGKTQGVIEKTKHDVDSARAVVVSELQRIRERESVHVRRVAVDSERLSQVRDSLTRSVGSALSIAKDANDMVLNRWAQVVEEEKRTPIADSRFWIRFDDIQENSLTNVALWFDDGRGPLPVRDVPTTIRIADSLFVTVDHHRYRLLAQAQFRDKGRFGGHNDRVVFRLDRIISDSAMRSSEKVRPVPP